MHKCGDHFVLANKYLFLHYCDWLHVSIAKKVHLIKDISCNVFDLMKPIFKILWGFKVAIPNIWTLSSITLNIFIFSIILFLPSNLFTISSEIIGIAPLRYFSLQCQARARKGVLWWGMKYECWYTFFRIFHEIIVIETCWSGFDYMINCTTNH